MEINEIWKNKTTGREIIIKEIVNNNRVNWIYKEDEYSNPLLRIGDISAIKSNFRLIKPCKCSNTRLKI